MVASQVEIHTKSYREEDEAAHWICDGSPEYTLKKSKKEDRGTEIILHIDEDSTEFLEESRINELLLKYNKFMPIPIKFGTEEVPDPEHKPKKIKDKDGKETTEPQKMITVDKIINNTHQRNDDTTGNWCRSLKKHQRIIITDIEGIDLMILSDQRRHKCVTTH